MKREPKKIAGLSNNRIIAAYKQGAKDRQDRKAPSPPKHRDERQAYINGYHDY